MKKYYYNSYRGFSNEFSIISVDQTDEKEVKLFEDFLETYSKSYDVNWCLRQISARQAREYIAAAKRTKRDYLAAGLDLHCNPVGATEIITATDFFYD